MPRRKDDQAPYWIKLAELERSMMEEAIAAAGSLRQAAQVLGVSEGMLIARSKQLGCRGRDMASQRKLPSPQRRGRRLASQAALDINFVFGNFERGIYTANETLRFVRQILAGVKTVDESYDRMLCDFEPFDVVITDIEGSPVKVTVAVACGGSGQVVVRPASWQRRSQLVLPCRSAARKA